MDVIAGIGIEGTTQQIKEFLLQYRRTEGRVQECRDLIATLQVRENNHQRSLILMREIFADVLEQQTGKLDRELATLLRELRTIVNGKSNGL